MKKIGVYVLTLLLLFSFLALAVAQDDDTIADDTTTDDTTDDTTADDTTTTDTTTDTTTSSTSVTTGLASTSTLGNWSKSFECLEEKAGDNCASINTVTEIALTVLASPDSIMKGCIEKLESKKQDNHFGSIKDTALALLALRHAGKDTALIEKWLLLQRQSPTDLIWFLQEDSDGFTKCIIDDGTLRYDNIEIDENKKINVDAGECLKRAQSNFWYKITPSCYSKRFKISCDKDFSTNLLYKNERSSTIYVLENTQTSPQHGTTEHSVNSKCLGTLNGCDYEGTAWATLALQDAGYEVNEFIPYLIAISDVKQSYLPDAFIYKITGYPNYGTQLIKDQKFNSYWEAPSSQYNRYYDTALALLSLGIEQEQAKKAEQWLLFEQGSNGCWANSVRETAFILWVIHQRDYAVTSSTEYCNDFGFFCIEQSACPSSEDVGENYYCSGTSKTCCKENNLQSCSEQGGESCSAGLECQGLAVEASDSYSCCLAGCAEPTIQETECEEFRYSCESSCGSDQEEVSFSCESRDVCCKDTFEEESESAGIPWWIWLLVVLILAVIGAILWFYRDKIKQRFKKGGEEEKTPQSGVPPGRPGMPPQRPGMRRPGMPLRRGGIPHRRPGMRRPGMPHRGGPRRPPLKPGSRPGRP